MKSFFGTIWRDIQIGVRLLTPFEPALAVTPVGSIVVTVLNILTVLDKIIPSTPDATKSALIAALALPNHPTADPKKLEAAIQDLLTASAPIGSTGLHSIATVEQLAAAGSGETKKATATLLMAEIGPVKAEAATVAAGLDNSVTALNRIRDLV